MADAGAELWEAEGELSPKDMQRKQVSLSLVASGRCRTIGCPTSTWPGQKCPACFEVSSQCDVPFSMLEVGGLSVAGRRGECDDTGKRRRGVVER